MSSQGQHRATTDKSLRSQVTILVVGIIAALAVLQAATSLKLYRDALEQQLRLKGDAYARAIAADSQLKVGLWAGYQKSVDERLTASIVREDELRFAAVLQGGHLVGFAGAPGVDGERVRFALEKGTPVPGAFSASAAIEETEQAPAKKTAEPDDLALLEPAAGGSTKDSGEKHATVVVGVETDSLLAGTLQHLALSAALGLLAVVLAVVLVGRVFASIFERMSRVRGVAEVLATGDLRVTIEDPTGDEVGALARSVDVIRERWTTIVRDIRGVADAVVRSTREIAAEAGRVAEGSNAQADAAGATATKSAAIVTDAQALKAIVEQMASITRESSETLSGAKDGSRSVATEMERMQRSLLENDGHRAELSRNIASIAGALGALSRSVRAAVLSADDIAQGMVGAVDVSNGIAEHARAAVAESGQALALVGKQRQSADAVARGAEETALATAALSDAMSEVLNTSALIRDIADMTSMLSLNASIIAAQAGDRALGFGTVAEEIRTLATRTRSAVDGIDRRTAEARRQLDAMGGVVSGLSSTVRTSRAATEEAATVLEGVLVQMNNALVAVGGLADLINGASDGTRASRDTVAGLDRELKNIDAALQSQRTAQLRLDESALVMAKNVGGVRDTGRAQLQSTEALIEGMMRLARATEELVSLSRAQSRSAEGIADETRRVKTVAERHRTNVDAIAAAVANLDAEAQALRLAIATLHVDAAGAP